MNIQELARQAIERINSMSLEELEKKFIEHGYVPSRFESCENYDNVVLQNVPSYGAINTLPSCNITAANQRTYFDIADYDMSIAA